MIGLETGVIKDEDFVIRWESIMWQNPKWNADSDFKMAFKNSNVWYYQELARRVGGHKMKFWLDKVGYGNADTSGGIDNFGLGGRGLRISPNNKSSFCKSFIGYKIYAKSGWAIQDGKNIGWYVGFLETNNNVYYFTNCVQAEGNNLSNFPIRRTEIVYQILDELKLVKK